MDPYNTISVDIILNPSWREPVKYKLLEPLEMVGVNVPEGFITDGASVPRAFWWLFPAVGRYFHAAVVHDYLLDETDASWTEAADKFDEALEVVNIPKWRRFLMYNAVRLWGVIRPMFGEERR